MYGNNYGYQPYVGVQRPIYQQQPMTQIPQMEQSMIQQPIIQQPIMQQPIIKKSLQGDMVDSIEKGKSSDYIMDGTISYFPLLNGSAIITKQLQNDGNCKTIIYKPVDIDNVENSLPKYATIDDIQNMFDKLDFKDLEQVKDDISEIKKALKKGKSGE